jgi:hypothetical protein
LLLFYTKRETYMTNNNSFQTPYYSYPNFRTFTTVDEALADEPTWSLVYCARFKITAEQAEKYKDIPQTFLQSFTESSSNLDETNELNIIYLYVALTHVDLTVNTEEGTYIFRNELTEGINVLAMYNTTRKVFSAAIELVGKNKLKEPKYKVGDLVSKDYWQEDEENYVTVIGKVTKVKQTKSHHRADIALGRDLLDEGYLLSKEDQLTVANNPDLLYIVCREAWVYEVDNKYLLRENCLSSVQFISSETRAFVCFNLNDY